MRVEFFGLRFLNEIYNIFFSSFGFDTGWVFFVIIKKALKNSGNADISFCPLFSADFD